VNGFWDRDAAGSRRGSKLARNWRSFLRLCNDISSGDVAFLQVAGSGDIHAVGVAGERFYDDQTPIWGREIEERRALYPWRVSFYIVVYSEEPIVKLYTGIENYVDGYGIGELPNHEAQQILEQPRGGLQSLGIDLKHASK